METEVTYKVNSKDLSKVLDEKLTELQAKNFINRYTGIMVSVPVAAEILQCCEETVRRKINRKDYTVIDKLAFNGGYRIDLGELLEKGMKRLTA